MLLNSFWRAVAYCLHPRVIGLSVLPLILMVLASFALGYLFWDAAVQAMRAWLDGLALLTLALGWLASLGVGDLQALLAPVLVLLIVTPAIVVLALLLVAWLMTPTIVDLVAQRRFPALQRRHGGGFWSSMGRSLWFTLLAVLLLLLSLPLWLIPPLALIIPPLIWGWLTYQVLAFDALAEHASVEEKRLLLRKHRLHLLAMGVLCGYLGAAPSLLWASGALFIVLAPLLVPLAVWIYALVFAFASLWFTHYLLEALQGVRTAAVSSTPVAAAALTMATHPASDVIEVKSREVP